MTNPSLIGTVQDQRPFLWSNRAQPTGPTGRDQGYIRQAEQVLADPDQYDTETCAKAVRILLAQRIIKLAIELKGLPE